MQHAVEEDPRALILGLGENLFWLSLLDNSASIEEDDTIRDLAGKSHLMRNHNHRAAFLGKLSHDPQHLSNQFRV